MRNKITLVFLVVVTLFSSYKIAEACTNILVTKGASKTGSVLISYSADSHALYGALYSSPRATYPAGTMKQIHEWDSGKYLGEIKEAMSTYSTIGQMNEHQLIITETTYGGRSELRDKTGIIDYGSLIYTTLQRAKTAREAIQVIADLTSEYGYYSSGESFSIGDANEVWYMEFIGKGIKMVNGENANKGIVYVAIKLPDGTMSAHANQARITSFPLNDPENCLYSKDVISFAKESGIYTERDGEFSFSDTYAPLTFGGLRACEARVWSAFNMSKTGMDKYFDYAAGHTTKERMPLYITPDKKLDVADVAKIMKDHYEGTPIDMTVGPGSGAEGTPFRIKPLSFEVDGVKYQHERPISTQQAAFWLVGEARSWMPDEIGGIQWWSVDDAGTSCLTPIYSSSHVVPEVFRLGNGDMLTYSPTSAFWLFNRLAHFAYLRYNKVGREIQLHASKFQKQSEEQVAVVDKFALELYKTSPESARQYVEAYSLDRAQQLFNYWTNLEQFLLVKYIDGSAKPELNGKFLDNGNGINMPGKLINDGPSEDWKRAVAEGKGGELSKVVVPDKVKKSKK